MISLTPLIDVVFILLVFFMLASSFIDWQEYEVATALPESSAVTVSNKNSLRLQLHSDGNWQLAGELINEQHDVTQQLAERFKQSADLSVVIQAGDGVPMQTTIDALDAVRAAGVKSVSLQPLGVANGAVEKAEPL